MSSLEECMRKLTEAPVDQTAYMQPGFPSVSNPAYDSPITSTASSDLPNLTRKRKDGPLPAGRKPVKKTKKGAQSIEGEGDLMTHGEAGRDGEGANKAKRVRTGCLTCRERHLKCDEAQPICQNCRKSNRQCKRGGRLNFIETQ